MGLETEVKIALSKESLEPLRQRLQAEGSVVKTPSTLEVNTLFDFADRRLAETGCALRMRRYGDLVLLTYKGPIREDPVFKRRPEFQTRVQDHDAMLAILAGVGLTPHFEYSKTREVQSMPVLDGALEVCLDETPVGCFVELEGSEAAIEHAIATLQLEPAHIVTQTYVALYLAAGMGRYRSRE